MDQRFRYKQSREAFAWCSTVSVVDGEYGEDLTSRTVQRNLLHLVLRVGLFQRNPGSCYPRWQSVRNWGVAAVTHHNCGLVV